jgi:hypothetical protein
MLLKKAMSRRFYFFVNSTHASSPCLRKSYNARTSHAADPMKVVLELSERTYRILEREAKRRGLERAEELIAAFLLEKIMEEVKQFD